MIRLLSDCFHVTMRNALNIKTGWEFIKVVLGCPYMKLQQKVFILLRKSSGSILGAKQKNSVQHAK